MKRFLIKLLLFIPALSFAADVKISQLPLGSAATTGTNDSFPYVSTGSNLTMRLRLWDLINLPPIVSTFAPKASPTFTGTVTAPTFAGALTGNASTASSLAANPTDCASNTYATTIAANGNLTCASISNASTTGVSSNTASTLVLRDGSGNFSAGTITAALTGTASGNTTYSANNHGVVLSGSGNAMSVIAPDASASKVLQSGGASADPTWLAFTNLNTNSTLVSRDGSGNFSAGTITAALTGAVTGTASGNTTYSANNHGVVLSGSGNAMSVIAPDSSVTKVLTSGGLSSDPTWATVTFPPLTGDVTTSGTVATLAATTNGTLVTLSAAAGVAVHGTNTNNSAAAGYVGEYVEAVIGSTNISFGNGSWGDMASMSLTAGDWEVTGVAEFTLGTAVSWNSVQMGVSVTSGNSTTGLVSGSNRFYALPPNSNYNVSIAIPSYRLLLSTTTTVYLKSNCAYASGSPFAQGARISARRMR